jgi:bifunctional non-homologous end joining protein LigD
MLDELGLKSFPKTSGSKGFQVYAPLNTAVSYEETKPFARALAQLLEKQHPKKVVSNMKKELRKGKVFVDWSQNDDHKTTICVYSLRAKERPTVSTPLEWDEAEAALEGKDADALVFDSEMALERADRHGDLFEPVLKMKQKLPAL